MAETADNDAIEDAQDASDRDAETSAATSRMTLRQILTDMRGRKRTGTPMPSSVQRNEERRKRRREERLKKAAAEAVSGAAGEGANNVEETPAAGTTEDGIGASSRSPVGDEAAHADQRTATEGGAEGGGDENTEDANEDPGEGVVVAPKVTIDADGNIVIDKESLVVAAGAIPATDANTADVVTIDNNNVTRHVTSSSFTKRDSAMKWSAADNQKFFEALSRFGTDFALMEHAFPSRSRRQIKLKFKREERANPQKVSVYLNARKRLNISDTRKEFGLKGDPPSLPNLPLEDTAARTDTAADGTSAVPSISPTRGGHDVSGSVAGSPSAQPSAALTPSKPLAAEEDDDDSDSDSSAEGDGAAALGSASAFVPGQPTSGLPSGPSRAVPGNAFDGVDDEDEEQAHIY